MQIIVVSASSQLEQYVGERVRVVGRFHQRRGSLMAKPPQVLERLGPVKDGGSSGRIYEPRRQYDLQIEEISDCRSDIE